jgi:hypothetical protein
MKEESISFLNANRHHWIAWETAQIFNQLDMSVRQGLLNVIREEWDAGYLSNLWCSPCVVELLRYAYTQYDKYLSQNKIQQ